MRLKVTSFLGEILSEMIPRGNIRTSDARGKVEISALT